MRVCTTTQAVDEKRKAEDISSVLYPNDATEYGKELRLKQQFFFVSASIQVRCLSMRLVSCIHVSHNLHADLRSLPVMLITVGSMQSSCLRLSGTAVVVGLLHFHPQCPGLRQTVAGLPCRM